MNHGRMAPPNYRTIRTIMKNHFIYTCSALVTAGMFTATFTLAKEQAASEKSEVATVAEMMKKIEAAGTPGAAHKALEPLVGEWTVEVKSWTEPDSPPTVTKGSAKAEWVMTGRFVREEFKGEMMGKPFTGMSLTGYDNLKKKYNKSGWTIRAQ